MDKNKIIQDVTTYIEPLLDEQIELVDVEFVKEGADYFLRIYIDKEGGITIDDCTAANRVIEPVLDEKDPIGPPYILEVSSPGIDRVLKKDKDFIKYAGHIVDVKLYQAINKQKKIQAELVEKVDGVVVLKDESENIIKIEQTNIVSIRLAVLF
ncbi:MAG: ribosome maturation factor RimP [Epulopiscium sp. Nuni2H_MBin001]|nr:MAG: ribosome maturation factor RimP [Epulopiscium sp. Nuni2H_MBin001]